MAIIHKTTLTPGKLDLLKVWLPAQPWYQDTGREPDLIKAGGFRLDDPQGEVGIEFMVVTDGSGDRGTTYLVPLTYRASARDGGDGALIGTAEHGVLGRRWVYDGTRDPVLAAQLVALIHGEAEPQAQSLSHTPDPTVIVTPVASGPPGQVTVRVNRILRPGGAEGAEGAGDDPDEGAAGSPADEDWQPCLSATWGRPDGTRARGVFATARPASALRGDLGVVDEAPA
jgi:Maltokinase N-terminal cap domain